MVDVFGKIQGNCSRFKVHSMEAAECTSPSTCAHARSSFPLSAQTKRFRESSKSPTNQIERCLQKMQLINAWRLGRRLVAARLRSTSIDRSIDAVLVFNYWADHECMVTARQPDTPPRCHGIMTPTDDQEPTFLMRKSLRLFECVTSDKLH